VIKVFAPVFMIGLAYSGQAFAQGMDSEAHSALSAYTSPETMGASPYMAHLAPGQFAPLSPQSHPAYPDGSHHQGGPGRPIAVLPLPMPLPMNNGPALNSPYGFQFPGSYMPRETPLHRFNGYVVCDPPDLSEAVTPDKATSPPARRLVKITSTRSLAAPGSSQPCPIYTVNGQPPKQKNYATTNVPPPPNLPPPAAKP
jgi:hypothetical protein